MKLKVQVTEEDIKNGVRKDPCKCPIALAVIRAVNNDLSTIDVDGDIRLYFAGESYICRDDGIKVFIDWFDAGFDVKPFEKEFEFELVEYDYDEY